MSSRLTDSSTWRLSTATGIPARLVSREGEFTEEGGSAQETYIIKADQLIPFVIESFPLPLTLFGTMLYPSPRRMPGFSPFRTTRVAWKAQTDGKPVDPFGTDPTADERTYCKDLLLTIDYGTSQLSAAGDSDPNDPFTFLEVTSDASGEFLTIPNRGTAFWEHLDGVEDAVDDIAMKDRDVPVSIVQPGVEWSVKWSRIPFNFFNDTLAARLRSKLGKVNNAPMPLFFNAPAETILFTGWSLQQQYSWREGVIGKAPMQLEMKFSEKSAISSEGVQVTHNHFYRPSKTLAGQGSVANTYPGWRKIIIVDSSANISYVYATTNLTSIFAPEE